MMTDQRRQSKLALAVVVLFVLTAGTFGTLWVLERGAHSDVSGQLEVVTAEIADVKAGMSAAQEKQDGLDKRNVEASTAKRTAETAATANRDCAQATKELHAAGLARDETEFGTKWIDVSFYCEAEE